MTDVGEFGAYLTTNDGRQFITPGVTPVNLLTKVSGAGAGRAEVSVSIDPSVINIPFIVSDAPAFASYSMADGVMTLRASRIDGTGSAVNMQAYVFSIKTPMPPAWGMAIWDENGKCILTNETRVLRDIMSVGTKGVDNDSGVNLSKTYSGKWAIMPELAGALVGVYQQRPINIPQAFYANYNGSTTVISSILTSTPPSGMQGSITSSKNNVKAIDASLYD